MSHAVRIAGAVAAFAILNDGFSPAASPRTEIVRPPLHDLAPLV